MNRRNKSMVCLEGERPVLEVNCNKAYGQRGRHVTLIRVCSGILIEVCILLSSSFIMYSVGVWMRRGIRALCDITRGWLPKHAVHSDTPKSEASRNLSIDSFNERLERKSKWKKCCRKKRQKENLLIKLEFSGVKNSLSTSWWALKWSQPHLVLCFCACTVFDFALLLMRKLGLNLFWI